MSDYLDPNNEELLKDFFSEAQMQVDTLEQNILVLENDGGNKDAVDEIFRAAHTLKGGSATVEMMELANFTHLVEDLLDAIRAGQISVTEDVVDNLLLAIDVIKAMLVQRMKGSIFQDDTSEIEKNLKELLLSKDKGKKAKAVPENIKKVMPIETTTPAKTASPAVASLNEHELQELKDAVDGDTPIYQVTVKFDKDSLMNTVGGIQVYSVLKSDGTVLRTIPEFEALYEDNFYPIVNYYVATWMPQDEIRKRVVIPDVSLDAEVTDIKSLSSKSKCSSAAFLLTSNDVN
jgi:two-component system chemotaxis sensor kinase CheA